MKLLINAFSGQSFCDHLLAADVTIHPEVAPGLVKCWANVCDKRWMLQMGKFFPIRIDFSYQAICHIDFHVFTIGTDHRNSEGLVSIPTRPVKRGFQHDLLAWVTLRFVKSGRRFWNAEDIADAVITNAVTRTEI